MPEFSGATAKLNLVEPKVFADYVLEQQTATNRLLSSGILTTDPIIQAQLLKGGTYVTIPTLQSLSGEAQTWNDTSDITVGNVDSYSAIAPQSVWVHRLWSTFHRRSGCRTNCRTIRIILEHPGQQASDCSLEERIPQCGFAGC